MIQQINESEKNRIRNLHREHFILNEQPLDKILKKSDNKALEKAITGMGTKDEYPDIPGFKKFITSLGILTYTKDLGRGDEITLQYSDSKGFDIDRGGDRPIHKEIHKELSKHGNVEVKGGGTMLVIPKVKNITNLLNGIKPLLNKIYR